MKRMIASAAVLCLAALVGCTASPTPRTTAKADTLHDEATAMMAQFNQQDPSLQQFLDKSAAYVIFPNVRAGAVGVGGAYGRGEVYQGGTMIGYADMSQANIGVQLGGQTYSELICFKDAADLDQFREGKMAFDARASAVAASNGAASAADYQRGVAIFTNSQGGLMVQAAIGGQKFRYEAGSSMATDR